jgi:hypothetical protein
MVMNSVTGLDYERKIGNGGVAQGDRNKQTNTSLYNRMSTVYSTHITQLASGVVPAGTNTTSTGRKPASQSVSQSVSQPLFFWQLLAFRMIRVEKKKHLEFFKHKTMHGAWNEHALCQRRFRPASTYTHGDNTYAVDTP